VGSDEDDRKFRLGLVKLADKLQPIGAGEPQIRDDDVIRLGQGVAQSGIAAGLHGDVVAAAAHGLLEAGGDAAIIFDQENFSIPRHGEAPAGARC